MRAHTRFCARKDAGNPGNVLQIPSERILPEFPIYIGGLSSKMTDIYDRRAHIDSPAIAAPAINAGSSAIHIERPNNV